MLREHVMIKIVYSGNKSSVSDYEDDGSSNVNIDNDHCRGNGGVGGDDDYNDDGGDGDDHGGGGDGGGVLRATECVKKEQDNNASISVKSSHPLRTEYGYSEIIRKQKSECWWSVLNISFHV